MKTFASEDDKAEHVNAELVKVTAVLDRIAEDTGDVYLVLKASAISSMLNLAWNVHKAIHDTDDVLKPRMVKAGYAFDEKRGWVRGGAEESTERKEEACTSCPTPAPSA